MSRSKVSASNIGHDFKHEQLLKTIKLLSSFKEIYKGAETQNYG